MPVAASKLCSFFHGLELAGGSAGAMHRRMMHGSALGDVHHLNML